MVALVWVAAALAVLYFWLAGHWFARVLAFLGFVVVLGLVGGERVFSFSWLFFTNVFHQPKKTPNGLVGAEHQSMSCSLSLVD